MATMNAARIITPKLLSERINRALNLRGVDQHGRGTELARLTGTSPQAAAKWLSGQVMPNNDNLIRIAANYGIDLVWLMTGDGDMFLDELLQEVKDNWRQSNEQGRGFVVAASRQAKNSTNPPRIDNKTTT